ncbi:hypothetical protein ACIOBL_01580 [Paenibacillus taichungensis]|uniref:hypothetical protein n=1 Tax=Paenibacillus taichungensis TaxID=484184 RepID=UPI0038210890
MPSIDSYFLGNYGLGGAAIEANPKSLLFSNIDGSLSVPPQSSNLIVWSGVTFEAGTKLISIHPSNAVAAKLTVVSGTIPFGRFALVDSAGIPWFLNANGSGGATWNVANMTINILSGYCYTVQASGVSGNLNGSTSTMWGPSDYIKPSNFNSDGPLSFALVATNANTTTTYNVSISVSNFRADWV